MMQEVPKLLENANTSFFDSCPSTYLIGVKVYV
jgi:hypothetical protein